MGVVYLGIALCLLVLIYGIRTLLSASRPRMAASFPATMQGAPLILLSLWGWLAASHALVSWQLHTLYPEAWIVLLGGSLVGLAGAIASVRLGGLLPTAPEAHRGDPPSLRMFRLVLNAGECGCILILVSGLPPAYIGDGLIGFLLGQCLGHCVLQAHADAARDLGLGFVREALNSFCSFAPRGVLMLVIIARMLHHSPALAASILLWLVAMKLAILFVSFIGFLLESPAGSTPDPKGEIAAPQSTAGLSSLWGMTAACTGLIFIGSYFLLGDSKTFPFLWRTLALWACGGILIRSALAHVDALLRPEDSQSIAFKAAIIAMVCGAMGGLTHNEPLLQGVPGGGWALSILASAISSFVLGELRPCGALTLQRSQGHSPERPGNGFLFASLLLMLTCLQLILRQQQEGKPFSWEPHFPAIGLGGIIGGWLAYGLRKQSIENKRRSAQPPGEYRLQLLLVFCLMLGLSLIQPYAAASCLVGMSLFAILAQRLGRMEDGANMGYFRPETLMPCAGLILLTALNITATAHSLRACHLAGATLIGLSALLRYYHRHGLTRAVT